MMGNAYKAVGDFAKARAAYEKAMELDPAGSSGEAARKAAEGLR
ncbi:MAG: tetratricopeptide repeat protein [Deltaproteobacteria bacterium]|nr:tetratricopeptide repeat protein [Deltaproteobacteria bacterium]